MISDGFVVIPFPDGQARTWGNWGWWIQSPWEDRFYGGLVELLPLVHETRQIGSRGVHIPLPSEILFIFFVRYRRLINTIPIEALRRLRWIGLAVLLLTWQPSLLLGRQLGAAFFVVGVAVLTIWIASCRARKFPFGYCESCGYNLKGNVSGIFPECGTSVMLG